MSETDFCEILRQANRTKGKKVSITFTDAAADKMRAIMPFELNLWFAPEWFILATRLVSRTRKWDWVPRTQTATIGGLRDDLDPEVCAKALAHLVESAKVL